MQFVATWMKTEEKSRRQDHLIHLWNRATLLNNYISLILVYEINYQTGGREERREDWMRRDADEGEGYGTF